MLKDQENDEPNIRQADGAPAKGDSRELKGLYRRGKPMVISGVQGPEGETRVTRSRSHTPAPPPDAAKEPANGKASGPAGGPSKPRGAAKTETPAEPYGTEGGEETGQGLADSAIAGLAKALGRGKKRAEKKAAAKPAEAQPKPNEAAPKPAQKGKGKGKQIANGEATNDNPPPVGDAAELVAAPKRVRRRAEVDEEEEGADWGGSGDDSEWEPDWKSEDDEDVAGFTQEEGALETEMVEPGLLALKDSPEAAEAEEATGAKPKKRGKGRKGKKKGGDDDEEEKARANSDDDVWRQYGSDEDLDAPYLPPEMDEMEPPAELLMPLLPYQKQFLGWAVRQEQGDIKGGILADEMGMGKTIQAISVIVTHRTDDNSKLPSLAASAAPQKPEAASKPTKRIKMKLPGMVAPTAAPPKTPPRDPGAGTDAGVDAEEWIDAIPGVTDAGLASSPSVHLHKVDTVVAEMMEEGKDDQALAAIPAASPGTEVKASQRPPQLAPIMAVGGQQSGCGKDAGDAAAPSGPFCRATLVVCPLVAVTQWRQEIARFTEPGTLKVVVYHGNKRVTSAEELENADVVLTTYSIIESEFRRHTQPNKATCTYCNKKFYPDRLKVHLRFFCGPNAKKSDALAKQQRKRPRADGRGGDDDDEDEDGGGKGGKGAGKSKGGVKGKGKAEVAAKGKGSSKGKKVAESAGGKKGKSPAKGSVKRSKGAKAPPAKRRKKAADSDDDDDPEFSANEEEDPSSSEEDDSDVDSEEEEDEEEEEAGPSRRRMRPKRVAQTSGWEARAAEEAEAMIAAAESSNKKAADVGQSVLHQVRWRRIILDEAHSIKDRRCSTARAVFALDSKFKWALSGTPLQNRVSELYSLIRFLRLYPYAYYFCNSGRSKTSQKKKQEACTCKSLDYSFKTNWRKCDHCGHSPLSHYCYWNKWVANPIKKFGYSGKGRSAMRLLRSEILEKVLLRRTKVQCADVLALPPRTVVLRKDRFDEKEEDFYEALYTQSQAQFNSYVETSTVLNNYAHVFSLLVRLRQAVNHPYLVVHSSSGGGAGSGAVVGGQQGSCTICRDPLEDGVAAECGHAFCRACITEYLEAAEGVAACQACEKPLTIDLHNAPVATTSRVAGSSKSSIINRVALSDFRSSTKIEAVREELHRMLQRDPSGKAIVFSQFTSMLDLIAFRLQQVGIRCVRLEGSMSMEQRDRMIASFTEDPDVKVFLMSLKAGGVALNLTAASHVFLCDLWWNPAIESQAWSRIHRLGQFKPIHVVRFVIGGTIEERILKLQEKKQAVFDATVGRDSDALGRLTEDDLRFLFG